MQSINEILAKELNISEKQVKSVVELLDDGNTVPFIARYRKEKTGGLSDEVLRIFFERLTYLRGLENKKEDVIRLIKEQGNLTQDLENKIIQCKNLTEVEDIYRPFKPKKRTRAIIATEKGLKPLAQVILEGTFSGNLNSEASKYISKEKEVLSEEDALKGAMDIISEIISDDANFRKWIREFIKEKGSIETIGKSDDRNNYEMYYEYK